MALFTASALRARASLEGYFTEEGRREHAKRVLLNEVRAAASRTSTYDIFLSHASEDAILIKALRDELVDAGFTVYVDWIDDPQLDRSRVTTETAAVLRQRMRQCRCLLFATSQAARQSVWMPWELGYMDALTTARVAIVPIVPEHEADRDFRGQEYLGLYPYIDKTGAALYVHRDRSRYVRFADWLNQRLDPR
ncbi:MAG: toll/interleukin-1 receptor domain-containing protein [Candidatus Didemnitutus sp.]|nr:toll/interleukin-1 receptor domain-containing protein [Candidatus Didemnitutus sp.]